MDPVLDLPVDVDRIEVLLPNDVSSSGDASDDEGAISCAMAFMSEGDRIFPAPPRPYDFGLSKGFAVSFEVCVEIIVSSNTGMLKLSSSYPHFEMCISYSMILQCMMIKKVMC